MKVYDLRNKIFLLEELSNKMNLSLLKFADEQCDGERIDNEMGGIELKVERKPLTFMVT